MIPHHARLHTHMMTKQTWTLLALSIVLGVLYVVRFTDLGSKQRIQINVSVRPFMPNAESAPVTNKVRWPSTAARPPMDST